MTSSIFEGFASYFSMGIHLERTGSSYEQIRLKKQSHLCYVDIITQTLGVRALYPVLIRGSTFGEILTTGHKAPTKLGTKTCLQNGAYPSLRSFPEHISLIRCSNSEGEPCIRVPLLTRSKAVEAVHFNIARNNNKIVPTLVENKSRCYNPFTKTKIVINGWCLRKRTMQADWIKKITEKKQHTAIGFVVELSQRKIIQKKELLLWGSHNSKPAIGFNS